MANKSTYNQERISSILSRCLDLIESGAGTVESVIELYPEFGEVLRPPLEAAQWLFSHSEVLNPRPGFVKVSRQRLVNRFQEAGTYARPGASERGRFTSITLERRLLIQYTALLTLTAVLLFVGYTSTAFIVQRSIPGDPLYQLKLTQENYRLALSLSEVGVAYLRIENAYQRVIEMQKLIADGREPFLIETLENFVLQMNAASTAIASIAANDQDKASQLSSFLTATLSAPLRNLVAVLDVAEYAATPGLLELLNVYIPEGTQPVPAVARVVTRTPQPSNTPFNTPTATFTPTPLFSFVTTPTVYYSTTSTATSSSRTEEQPTLPSSSTPLPTGAPPGEEPTPQPTSTPRPPSQPRATPTPQPSDQPSPTDAPTNTPAPPPTSTPRPTAQPTHTPRPTQAPTNTPLPTQAPTNTPLPTQAPTHTPLPTSKPTIPPTPQPTDEPEPTPEPTIRNWKTPKPTSFP